MLAAARVRLQGARKGLGLEVTGEKEDDDNIYWEIQREEEGQMKFRRRNNKHALKMETTKRNEHMRAGIQMNPHKEQCPSATWLKPSSLSGESKSTDSRSGKSWV